MTRGNQDDRMTGVTRVTRMTGVARMVGLLR